MDYVLPPLRWLIDQVGDKIVDLAITLIVIDRILSWREKRKWRKVRPLVNIRLEAALGDYLRAWARWLHALREEGMEFRISEVGKIAFKKSTGKDLDFHFEPEELETFLWNSAGDPVPVHNDASFIETADPSVFTSGFSAYLMQRSLPPNSVAWEALVTEVGPIVDAISSLADRIQSRSSQRRR